MDLREACVREALTIIKTAGLEGLSLREVARRLGVSHQAPYKHFPSRDHILAEVVRRAYDDFARHLDATPPTADPHADLHAMGVAYLDYALAHPLEYRLMFSTPLPDPTVHPAMMHSAQHAFALLQDCLTRLFPNRADPHAAALDALYVWSTMHGLAAILQSPALENLGLPVEVIQQAVAHTLMRIGAALGQ